MTLFLSCLSYMLKDVKEKEQASKSQRMRAPKMTGAQGQFI